VPIAITFSEAVFGSPKSCVAFVSADLTIARTGGGTFTAGVMVGTNIVSGLGDTDFSLDIVVSVDADGTLTVQVGAGAVTDAAGNANTASAVYSVTLDFTPPVVRDS
jgi:hypothetical protein